MGAENAVFVEETMPGESGGELEKKETCRKEQHGETRQRQKEGKEEGRKENEREIRKTQLEITPVKSSIPSCDISRLEKI